MTRPHDHGARVVAATFARRYVANRHRSRVSAPDTVPFALWCAARHLDDYVEAMWQTVSGLGDRDTTCAIVGGIVAAAGAGVPSDWRASREPFG
jgi:ADP-ribosylglycohydrolase